MAKIKAKLQQVTAISAAILISSASFLRPAQANPAIAAPLALCSTGIGCVLVGSVLVAGVTYYVWEYGGGKRVVTDTAGNIMRMLDDPENPDGVWEDPLDTRNYKKAQEICRARANKIGASVEVIPDPVTGKWICRFTGGTGK